jgi:hypothetical protein
MIYVIEALERSFLLRRSGFWVQNAMIENLVTLTHVPRQKILQWFDEQRSKNETRPTFEDAL